MDERFGTEELVEAERWELVSRTAVGRLAVCLDGRPHIFPINFVRDADSIGRRVHREATDEVRGT